MGLYPFGEILLPFSVKFLGDVYLFGIQGLARFAARNPSGVIYVDIAWHFGRQKSSVQK